MTMDTSLNGGAVHMKQIGSEPNVTCEKEIQVANSGVSALIQHSKQKIHKEKACIQLAAHKIEPEKEKDEQQSSSQQSLKRFTAKQ